MINRRTPDPRRQTADRRESWRQVSEGHVRFLRAGTTADAILHGDLLDVSPTGVSLLLDERLEPDDRLLIEVRDVGNRCFNLTAQVVWSEPADRRHRIGCELCVELSPRQHAALKQLAVGS